MDNSIKANKATHLLAFIFGVIFGVEVFTRCVIQYHDEINIDCAIQYLEQPNAADNIRLNCKK